MLAQGLADQRPMADVLPEARGADGCEVFDLDDLAGEQIEPALD